MVRKDVVVASEVFVLSTMVWISSLRGTGGLVATNEGLRWLVSWRLQSVAVAESTEQQSDVFSTGRTTEESRDGLASRGLLQLVLRDHAMYGLVVLVLVQVRYLGYR